MHVKNTYRLLVICTVAVTSLAALSSCNNNKGNKATNDSLLADHSVLSDSMQIIHDIDSADYTDLFKYKANTWLSKVLNNSQTKWDNFHLVDYWKDDSLKRSSFKPAKNFYTDYAMYLKWSPDSNYIFDMGSYGVTVVKDKQGNTSIESGDIDNEVTLLDPVHQTKTRLLFFGPGTTPVNARWLDSSQVALVGLFDTSSNHQPDTLMWLIDVKEKFFRKYSYHQ
jgi:hypothetical protein